MPEMPEMPEIEQSQETGRVPDFSELSIQLAGQIGQASLDRLASVAHPDLDQHVAAVRDAMAEVLGQRTASPDKMISALVKYASGFVDAAIARGWWPSPVPDQPLDWESVRLAAVCQLVTEASQTRLS